MSSGKSAKSGGSRCRCGWTLGENISGNCVPCNEAIAKLPRRRMRAQEATEASQQLQDDDVFEPDKPLPPASRKYQKKPTLSKAEKAALAAQQEAADLRSKQDADSILEGNGFVRGTVVEKGVELAGLVNPDWFPIITPRDGHCLVHCFLQILKDRQPDNAVRRMCDMRECLAQYFETHDNKLEIFYPQLNRHRYPPKETASSSCNSFWMMSSFHRRSSRKLERIFS
jgi:hypothetical protein